MGKHMKGKGGKPKKGGAKCGSKVARAGLKKRRSK
jgi:hypothetical protein